MYEVNGVEVTAEEYQQWEELIAKTTSDFVSKIKEKRNKPLEIGDMVKIVKPGSGYSCNDDFFKENNLFDMGVRFRYGVVPEEGTIGEVVYKKDNKFVIQVKEAPYVGNATYSDLTCDNAIYLMSNFAIRKVVN